MTIPTFDKLLTFLNKLEQQKISYTLAHHRDEAVMVTVAVPGERWEVEFLSDGSVEVEKFISNGEIALEEALSDIMSGFSLLIKTLRVSPSPRPRVSPNYG